MNTPTRLATSDLIVLAVCQHHWLVESPGEDEQGEPKALLNQTCKKCAEERLVSSSLLVNSPWRGRNPLHDGS